MIKTARGGGGIETRAGASQEKLMLRVRMVGLCGRDLNSVRGKKSKGSSNVALILDAQTLLFHTQSELSAAVQLHVPRAGTQNRYRT